MKSILLRATLMSVMALALGPRAGYASADAPTDAEVEAHKDVLDLAGAFTNDGFKLRDGYYAGMLKTGQSVVIQVNLYAGNEYWFSVATAKPESAVTIAVYDEAGNLVKTNPYTDAHRAAAGFSPDNSGPFYLKIADTGAPATYCTIYSYK